jgi:glycosyltransferase involved in cell wall biosynthesis
VYLVKSLGLVPLAAYFGEELERRGLHRVHAHWAAYSTTVALTTHWLFDIPFSFSAHAYDIYMKPHLLGMKVREANFAVTCARVNAGFLRQIAGPDEGRVVVNYHGVSLDRFKPVDGVRRPDLPTVVTCGRLEPYKGHHVLLRAIARIGRPVRCVVVGEGPQRKRLENLASELGIADRVEFTGPVPQARLAEIYAGADVFTLASVVLEQSGKRDVIPNVLAEAMAMRIAVVASDVSGIGELVEDGVSGRLVPPNDVDALARVLAELLDDDDLRARLAAAGAEKVKLAFDRSVNILDLADLFRAENGAGPLPRPQLERDAGVPAEAVQQAGAAD